MAWAHKSSQIICVPKKKITKFSDHFGVTDTGYYLEKKLNNNKRCSKLPIRCSTRQIRVARVKYVNRSHDIAFWRYPSKKYRPNTKDLRCYDTIINRPERARSRVPLIVNIMGTRCVHIISKMKITLQL